jgi:hypothetical protein
MSIRRIVMAWRRSLATLFILCTLLVSVGGAAAQVSQPAPQSGAAEPGTPGRGSRVPAGAIPANGFIPLTDVLISGPTVGSKGAANDFTATANPITATTPITYFWEATGQSPVTHVGTLTDTVSFAFSTSGNKTITVTATNPAGSVFNTHDVAVSEPTQLFLPVVMRACTPVYADDFSNPASGWDVFNSSHSSGEYLNGEYRLVSKDTQHHIGDYPNFQAEAVDYDLLVDVRNATGVFGSYGLIFDVSDDATQYYEFDVASDGHYGVFRRDPGNWVQLTVSSSGFINQGTVSNRLKVERNGAMINVYANGQLLTSLSDSTYVGLRHTGVIDFSYDQPNVDARFDNFAVYALNCGASAAQAQPSGAPGQAHWFAAASDRPRLMPVQPVRPN